MARKYNYIFSHDKPQRGAGYRGAVYVPETDTTYKSTAEAAKALGVDPSNISKVLKGKRKTAGGYHFEKTTAEEDQRRKLLKQIREQIRKANNIIKEARVRKRENFVQEVAELDDFGADVIGSTQDNLIDDAADTLDEMDMDELKQLENKLNEKIKAAEKGIQKADERLQEYADVFGVSSAEMEKYEPMIPEINRTIDRAHDNGCGSDVFEYIRDQIQNNVDPAALQDLLDKINDYFDGRSEYKNIYAVFGSWQYREFSGKSWEDVMEEMYGKGWNR